MMANDNQRKLEQRVARAADAALAERRFVTALDVVVGIGWLSPQAVDRWRQGRVEYLEREVQANLHKISTVMALFRRWAEQRDLQPSEAAYVARTRDRRPLRFSASGAPGIERAYRTHWVSPELSEAKRAALAEKQSRPPDLVVVRARKDWTCTECSGGGELLLMEDPGPLCMACADLDHLVYLPAGNAALTRRAKRASRLGAVVVRFSRARGRYGAEAIARQAAARGSGRIGRTTAGRALDPDAVTLAVAAAVRHGDTAYDELLMSGLSRTEARQRVRPDVRRILDAWRSAATSG
jgi:hypothetical protein